MPDFIQPIGPVYDAKPFHTNHLNRTRIGYETELTHPQTVEYLRLLVDFDLLNLTDFKPIPFYGITKKGRQCLQLLGALEDELRPSPNVKY